MDAQRHPGRRHFLAAMATVGFTGLPFRQAGAQSRAGMVGQTTVTRLPDALQAGGLVYDVSAAGYLADEFLVAGMAPIYPATTMADAADMSKRDNQTDLTRRDFRLPPISPPSPYVTRVVVYRPADAGRFNGRVIVEPNHPIGGGILTVFGTMNDAFLADGNIHVSVAPPVNFANLKASDPARYAGLQAADPTQIWGMLRDVGLALKTGTSLLPAAYRTRATMMTGYSWTGVATASFANFHHDTARLPDGRPIYDAYLPMANATYVRDIDVPVMRFNTQSDFDSFGALSNRKPDSDAKGSQFRLYEMAGASHARHDASWPGQCPSLRPLKNYVLPQGLPKGTDACTALFPKGSAPNSFPLHHYAAAAFAALWQWVLDGKPPPPGALIATDPSGLTRLDRFGNAEGGLRSSELDVPAATYGVGPKQGICALPGYTLAFDDARMRELYGTPDRYRQRVADSVASLTAARRLRPREAAFVRMTEERRW